MLLLNVCPGESALVVWFNDNDVPNYAILSHTWGPDEISYQELVWINRIKAFSTQPNTQSSFMLMAMGMMMGNGNSGSSFGSIAEDDLLSRRGYSKIIEASREAQNLGYKYVWIDTCCIDKSSSAELQEAINSMYRWYENAEVCLVYLEDIPTPRRDGVKTASEIAKLAFETSRWSTRGWTLQELVAPAVCRFYFGDWTLMGEKVEFLEELSQTTGIPTFVFEERRSAAEVSVAERMSWAAFRKTTRIEDQAYCLLGLFDIQMPLLYGEGEKAFTRLQEQILKTTDDYSLFAWSAVTADESTYRGLLARSPVEFRDCGTIELENVISTFPIGSTPIGLRVQFEFLPDPKDKGRVVAMIRSSNSMNQRLAIRLICLDGGMQYARVDAGSVVPIDDWPTGQLRTIYVRQKLSVPPDFITPEFRCFHVGRRIANQTLPPVRIISVFPRELWNSETHELQIPNDTTEAFGVLLLRVQSHTYAHSLNFPVAFGFNRTTCHYWCKAVPNFASAAAVGARRGWQELVKEQIPAEVYDPLSGADVRHDIFVVGDSGLGINVSIKAGLCQDTIALRVNIDGLVKWG
ncbi:HET-domain-containing protein [Dothidotthia symphoricarpi CBS 119687]|uniref:HET-domain-containing protein n=1 Tax=Dothidotthia symphoricarpi CBS 119687 TaxID=1392245 RepID=A0A6A6A736_9PLEO|nr:HET-domain-containing protein [Dothidotthia symphoricarpi CBS 119687]KAF2126884.1 HET-domain-containing protein [Dothidotthia symphoricarpi CBS 119687]